MSSAIELLLNSAKTVNTPTKNATVESLSPFDGDLFIFCISCFFIIIYCLKKQQTKHNRKQIHLQYLYDLNQNKVTNLHSL